MFFVAQPRFIANGHAAVLPFVVSCPLFRIAQRFFSFLQRTRIHHSKTIIMIIMIIKIVGNNIIEYLRNKRGANARYIAYIKFLERFFRLLVTGVFIRMILKSSYFEFCAYLFHLFNINVLRIH